MRRVLFFTLVFTVLGSIVYAFLKDTPWLISHLPEGSNSASPVDSMRKQALYDATLVDEVDSLSVVKHLRELYVYRDKKLLKIYRMSLGDAPIGHKQFRGDEKTPEGLYRIDGKNPYSSCHKNLGISYPNASDRAFAKKNGFPSGGDIKIHGLPNGQGKIGKAHLLSDWTNGCIAVTDEEIDELYRYTNVGVPIYIMP